MSEFDKWFQDHFGETPEEFLSRVPEDANGYMGPIYAGGCRSLINIFRAARRSAIERAARVADKFEEVSIEMHAQGHADHARNIATAIRNLAHKEEG